MLYKEIKHEFEIDGRKCSFETGKLALKSESSILAKMGDTVITVNVNTKPLSGEMDYFPLSVEYIEKFYASGKISGSRFVKRERFPSDDAILKARMIDRAIRPRFPHDYKNEVSVIVTVMSYDEENDPALLAINAVSVALMASSAPFEGPLGAVRLGLEGENIVSVYKAMDLTSDEEKMNYVVAGDGEVFTMIDAGVHIVPEEKLLEGMEKSLEMMSKWIKPQEDFLAKLENIDKTYEAKALSGEVIEEVRGVLSEEEIRKNLESGDSNLHTASKEKLYTEFEGKYAKADINEAYEFLQREMLRKIVLTENKRVDGRAMDEIREMATEVDLLPRVHGSALFTRGVTQTLTIATLGSLRDVKLVDDMEGEREQRYMHFYNDLPFAYGDVDRVRLMPSRRAIGHGMLAEKALWPVIPSEEEFPYTMLVMSEIQGENGSSSMASACGSSMALMAAGVPIKDVVGGIACGLVTGEEGEFKVLTDMQGVEDFYGDMDFKITGTLEGVTAVQMDTKTKGLSMEVVRQTFAQSKEARQVVIAKIKEAIAEPREEMSQYAPRVVQIKVPTDKIGEIIGPGGKNIRELSEKTGAEIEIEEDGTVNIYSTSKESIDAASKAIGGYNFVPEVGEIYEGKVASIMPYGAFVDLAPNISGLLHVSEMADKFIKDVREYVNEGDVLKVKIIGIDKMGKIKLSIKGVK
ncbi:TPA: polyribonucleotide nucleotidyltransferase [Candidatus Dojkabacteria bacterium]|uniref:Polyribonucleotide nucleotidyltransferase n=1 Tax=Candidatus Dojkabacteria bacterium TaxID=2099670 RepID=A0A832QCS6_9BACT|nr:polyribonucleotide nucleotidyltransferase [Candidatus Dojkabacteria bacterium]